MGNFVIDLSEMDLNDSETMDNFQKIMDQVQDETVLYMFKIAEELGVSNECAADIVYLRTRSRWTQALEDKLIQLHKSGNPPNICEFGCSF